MHPARLGRVGLPLSVPLTVTPIGTTVTVTRPHNKHDSYLHKEPPEKSHYLPDKPESAPESPPHATATTVALAVTVGVVSVPG